jgi:hypothetical protein
LTACKHTARGPLLADPRLDDKGDFGQWRGRAEPRDSRSTGIGEAVEYRTYGSEQSAEPLKARFEEFSFGPMPLARIAQIIEGPARVAGLSVDDAFVQQAVRDAETADALPRVSIAAATIKLALYQKIGVFRLRSTKLNALPANTLT